MVVWCNGLNANIFFNQHIFINKGFLQWNINVSFLRKIYASNRDNMGRQQVQAWRNSDKWTFRSVAPSGDHTLLCPALRQLSEDRRWHLSTYRWLCILTLSQHLWLFTESFLTHTQLCCVRLCHFEFTWSNLPVPMWKQKHPNHLGTVKS